ncbi:MAG TPA: valine--tRNA ligase [Actinomycetota bacterium]|nr:valine--tRNA ligase [Actinomycetota bacterium]
MSDTEERWRRFWDEQGTYRYDPARGRDETFVVDTPPPTVSGALHVGHVFSYTHTDLVVRYRRMRGDNVFYPMGWDDNGLPTERRVQNVFNVRCDPRLPYDPGLELEFGRKGDTLAISRPNFIELCDRVVSEDEKAFMDLFRRLALSVDWNETYATIDRRSRLVSQLSFLNVLAKGEAELREAPTMWDVDFQTAVAQAEVEDRERDGAYHRIRFATDDGGVVIATTRPELLPACIAVVAHPDDERYAHLFGTTAVTPLFHAPVPVLADEGADPSKGSGILMVCTFGDASDVEWWRTLGVPPREVIDRNGRIRPAPWGEGHWTSNDAAAAQRHYDKLVGLTVNQARRTIVELLEDAGAIDGEPEPTRRAVKFFEKGERPLEFVVTRQWFVKVLDKKRALIEQGRKIEWHPDMFRKRYEDWVEGLNQDWCVSRQRYFGVPIPVWYAVRDDGSVDYDDLILPRREDLPVDPSAEPPPGRSEDERGRPGGFVGDPDVFDTWATSALTPMIASGWPDDDRHRDLYPGDLRPQGHDIIRTWAFVTITRSLLEDGSIPWRHVAISGWILDPDRKKMSKSKGNAIVPTEILDRHGPDAVRYWSASARLGVDAAFDPNVFKEGRRLVTKLRNAARLVSGYEGESGEPRHPLDRALVARLARLVDDVTARWDEWDHAGALDATETWFWSDFCDNYLELSKQRAYGGDPSALGALRCALDVVVRLFAPVLPYVTEDVYNEGRAEPASVHRAPWPAASELPGGHDDGCFDAAVAVVTQVRKAKSEAKVSLKFPVERLVVRGPRATLDVLEPVMADVCATANVESHELVADDADDADELRAEVTLGERPS